MNINSMHRIWNKLKLILEGRKLDILCIQETHRIDKELIKKECDKLKYITHFNCIDNKNETENVLPNDKKLYYQGTAILVKKELQQIKEKIIIVKHRAQKISLKNRECTTEVWNVYAPTDVGKQQTDFFKVLNRRMKTKISRKIICGDFSVICHKIDARVVDNFRLTAAAKSWLDT